MDPDKSTDYDGVIVRVKGDGQNYSLRFRTNNNWDGVSYQAKFNSLDGEWAEIKIPFEKFNPTLRGRFVPNRPPLVSDQIRQMGILIADKQTGKFSLDIDWIKFYKEKENEV